MGEGWVEGCGYLWGLKQVSKHRPGMRHRDSPHPGHWQLWMTTGLPCRQLLLMGPQKQNVCFLLVVGSQNQKTKAGGRG